jgi:short-subunit dehydrogenase
LTELLEEIGHVDLIVICAGVGFINRTLDWSPERDTIAVNVTGFAAMANVAFRHFLEQRAGHLVNISSIAAIRGNGSAPAYNASKAFESNYMDGLRHKVAKLRMPIAITDVQPGFVDTPMAKGEGRFWMASAEEAAAQIYRAILRRKKHVYVTKRWRLIAWLLKLLPDSLYYKI